MSMGEFICGAWCIICGGMKDGDWQHRATLIAVAFCWSTTNFAFYFTLSRRQFVHGLAVIWNLHQIFTCSVPTTHNVCKYTRQDLLVDTLTLVTFVGNRTAQSLSQCQISVTRPTFRWELLFAIASSPIQKLKKQKPVKLKGYKSTGRTDFEPATFCKTQHRLQGFGRLMKHELD